MSNNQGLAELRKKVEGYASAATSSSQLMRNIVTLLHENLLKYNWVGFYMLDGSGTILELGPFEGAMTPHTRIPLNQGICGAAASSGATVVVDDVKSDPRYLSCSLETKSEIVAPVMANGKVIGEIDIDSHFLAAFATEDREFVEYCAEVVGKYIEKEHS